MMFNSLNKNQKLLGMTLIAWLFGYYIGASSSGLIVIVLSYTLGFIWGGLSMYLAKSEKFNTWLSSKLFWRRKNV